MTLHTYSKLLFVGMPVADILIGGKEAQTIMQQNSMTPGQRSMFTPEQTATMEASLSSLSNYSVVAGGSMANTACTVSKLCPEKEISFLCLCADDDYGSIFTKAVKDAGIHFADDTYHGTETSRSYVITDDTGERAIARYMGDSMDTLTSGAMTKAIAQADIIFLEGELLALKNGYALWQDAQTNAKAHNTDVGITLFGSEQINQHRPEYLRAIRESVSVVFGNEEELIALYPDTSFDDAYQQLVQDVFIKESAKLVCISHGEGVAIAHTRTGETRVSPTPVSKVINTLGAGDAFMSGVLSGFLKGYSSEDALAAGHRIAGAVIQQHAPQLDNPSDYF